MDEPKINWNEVVKKEERGLDSANLGEVQGLDQGLIVTKRGLVDKHTFYFLVDRFDGETLFLKVTDKDAGKYEGR
jgi:hypothetical protein